MKKYNLKNNLDLYTSYSVSKEKFINSVRKI